MQIDNLSWFPGHMTKTKRMISAEIKNMDAVCEIVDARIPMSSRNPDVDELTAGKPRLIVLNRADQADPAETRRWTQYFRAQGYAVLEANAKSGVGTEKFSAAVRELLRDKLAAAAARGQVGKVVRVMVLGVPNVGKSTFINKVAHRKTARAEDRPGVTRFQAVGPRGPHAGAAGYPRYPLAEVRRPGGWQAFSLYRSGEGRCAGYRGAGLLSHGLFGRPLRRYPHRTL